MHIIPLKWWQQQQLWTSLHMLAMTTRSRWCPEASDCKMLGIIRYVSISESSDMSKCEKNVHLRINAKWKVIYSFCFLHFPLSYFFALEICITDWFNLMSAVNWLCFWVGEFSTPSRPIQGSAQVVRAVPPHDLVWGSLYWRRQSPSSQPGYPSPSSEASGGPWVIIPPGYLLWHGHTFWELERPVCCWQASNALSLTQGRCLENVCWMP